MKAIINGKQYDTATAQLLASDRYWDGSNFERNGRNMYLYKTPKGRFFFYVTTCWQGERNYIQPLTRKDAMGYYEELHEKEMTYDEAFGINPEQA